MPSFRSIRALAREAGNKVFRITLSGPAKGPKPISFDVEAPDAKTACNHVRRLVAVGRLSVEPRTAGES
jgi:hypothetical protein